MTLDQKNNGQRQSGPSNIVFPVGFREHQPKELYGETNPKEEIELDEAKENLIAGIHFLDAAISTKKFVHLPAEFVVDFPPEGDVRYLRDGDNNRNDARKDMNRYVNDASCRRCRMLNFSNLYDGVDEEKNIE